MDEKWNKIKPLAEKIYTMLCDNPKSWFGDGIGWRAFKVHPIETLADRNIIQMDSFLEIGHHDEYDSTLVRFVIFDDALTIQVSGQLGLPFYFGKIVRNFHKLTISAYGQWKEKLHQHIDLSGFHGEIIMEVPGIQLCHYDGDPHYGKISVNSGNVDFLGRGPKLFVYHLSLLSVLEINNHKGSMINLSVIPNWSDFTPTHFLPSGFLPELTIGASLFEPRLKIANNGKLKVREVSINIDQTLHKEGFTRLCKQMIEMGNDLRFEQVTITDPRLLILNTWEILKDVMGGILLLKLAGKMTYGDIRERVTIASASKFIPNFPTIFNSILENFEEFSSPEELEEFIQDNLE